MEKLLKNYESRGGKTMKNKIFVSKEGKETGAPSNMERLKRSITAFCMAITDFKDEAENALQNMRWDEDVDPIIYWRFCPVCTFEAGGSHEMAHRLRHNRLFGKNGLLLESRGGKCTSILSEVMEAYELWLLEDMTLQVVFSCKMKVTDKDDYTEYVTYRYPVKDGYTHFYDMEVEDFLSKIETMIFVTRNHI